MGHGQTHTLDRTVCSNPTKDAQQDGLPDDRCAPLRPADSSLSYPRPPSQPPVSAEPSGQSGEAAWPRLGRGGGV
eukprot:scaffold91697_cov67-Phaeocystis_antarctica.AAC.1